MPRFIDLFAGLGGFHLALSRLGEDYQCVFASELRADLRRLYAINYPGTPIRGDITQISLEDIPAHDILCAGFPCQPFSQAGKRQGFEDEDGRGNLFYKIAAIIGRHRPRYVLLENVANLQGHDGGRTWQIIKQKLEDELDYEVRSTVLSPHEFGIPQHRRRIYIVCEDRREGRLEGFTFPKPQPLASKHCSIEDIIDYGETHYQHLKSDTRQQIEVWESFLRLCAKHKVKVPSFPIWAMEFGASYEFESKTPYTTSVAELRAARGTLGRPVEGQTLAECLSCLPPYARTPQEVFPSWKQTYIRKNRAFYEANRHWLKSWLRQIETFYPSHQKLEWNCGDATPTLEDKILQFRASGLRVKMPTFAPALNLVGTQVPILPWIDLPPDTLTKGEKSRGRYMTVHEASKLQGMERLRFGDDAFQLSDSRCYEALGNAVNVTIVERIARNLIER